MRARALTRTLAAGLGAMVLCACTDAPAAADTTVAPAPETAAQPDDRYAAFAAVLERHLSMSARVSRLSRRLRVANAPLCTVTRPDVGLSTHSLSDYPEGLRPLALHFMDLGEQGRYVRAVVPGSPADTAGLAPGTRLLSGWPVREDGRIGTPDGAVDMVPDTACVAPAFVVNAPVANAGTDGREIELTTALVEQVPDDAYGDEALAFIIAHEMSHVLRGHTPTGPRWTAELEADADALVLMRNAGFDVARTVSSWEAGVEAHRESQSMSATHPPLDIRLKRLEAALARLEAGPDGFVELAD